jgi:radical SAM superfamily enzyme
MIPFPDYSLFLEDKFSKHMYIPGVATARGCMYQCYFCSEGNSPQRRYRPRSTENIKKELELIKAYYQNQLPYLAFVDDTFTSSYERTIQMCDIINDVFPDKAQFGFYCEGRVNVLSKHPDLMAHLKQAGLLRLQIGIESGSQDILDRINKQIRTKQIETVVQLCESNDIPTIFGAFICGLPGQTEDDVKKDIEYAKQLIDIAPGRMELEMSILSLLPGSEFYKNSSKWNFSVLDSECLTGLVTEDCFNETPLLRRSKIIELRSLFRDEISRYNMEKSMSIPRRKLLEHIVIATRRRMIPLTVRQMIRYPHANWLVLLRARQDHCFLWEVPQKRWEYIIPVHVENQVTPCNDNFIINEKSPMAFLLTKTEKQYYDYFAGKLSFTKIAEKISQQRKITQEQALNECVAVYEKCEQNLTAIVMA